MQDRQTKVQINFEMIRERAEATGLTVREIAEKAGVVSHSTVHDILKGKREPTAVKLKQVCNAIGLPIQKAFYEEKIAA